MALAATLEADFGDGGFDLTATVDGVGVDLTAIDVPSLSIDGTAIGDAASLLDGVGSDAIGAAVTKQRTGTTETEEQS